MLCHCGRRQAVFANVPFPLFFRLQWVSGYCVLTLAGYIATSWLQRALDIASQPAYEFAGERDYFKTLLV